MNRPRPNPSTPRNKASNRLKSYQERINRNLERALRLEAGAYATLHEAMSYSVQAGGKRLRPLLAFATAEAMEVDAALIDDFGSALELIHTYSLIHDDLPAMDDDDLRRGKPSCHIAYGEAPAILAGDALLTLAFRVISQAPALEHDPGAKVALINDIAQACGARGMAGGQVMDLLLTGDLDDTRQLQEIYRLKTGALLKCAIMCPLSLAGPSKQIYRRPLELFAERLGLAYQVYDDYLDVTGDTKILGKPACSDVVQDKSTYPAIVGTERALDMSRSLMEEAFAALDRIDGDTSLLSYIASEITTRSH